MINTIRRIAVNTGGGDAPVGRAFMDSFRLSDR